MHGAYYYDAKTGAEMICGMKIINQDEQVLFIQNAASICEIDTVKQSQHMENYNRYEADGEIKLGSKTQFKELFNLPIIPVGYCKKSGNPRHGVRHSVSPWISHNCAECLAEDLIHTRAISPGVDIDIVAAPTEGARTIDIKTFEKISVKLVAGRAEVIFGRQAPIILDQFELIIRTAQKPVIILGSCFNKYSGKSIGTLTGIHICETILMGGICKSLDPSGPTYNDFMTRSVPVGYSAWTEIMSNMTRNNKTREAGKIWIHRKCKRCTVSEKIVVSPIKTTEHLALDVRDRTIQALISENQKLRETIIELQIKLAKYE